MRLKDIALPFIKRDYVPRPEVLGVGPLRHLVAAFGTEFCSGRHLGRTFRALRDSGELDAALRAEFRAVSFRSAFGTHQLTFAGDVD